LEEALATDLPEAICSSKSSLRMRYAQFSFFFLFLFIRNFAISPAVANGKIPLLPGGDGFPACRAVHHMALLVGFYQKL